MRKGSYRLNLQVDWRRNLDPALKTAFVCATYGRDSGAPAYVAIRLSFWTDGHTKRWLATYSTKAVGGRITLWQCARPDGIKRGVLYVLDIDLSSSNPLRKYNEKGAYRYYRFMKAIEADNYKIDWQTPPYIPRLYETRQALEAALG